MNKPTGVATHQFDACFVFLDTPHESGKTNMFGAMPYLIEEFPALTQAQAGEILVRWMETYSVRHPKTTEGR